MGSPDFAVPALDTLVQNGYDVVAVITATDKYGGRGGKKLIQTAVKKYADEKGIPTLQPPNLKNPIFIKELEEFKADLQIVVAFRMLPIIVWDMPKYGTYNLHGSLLPRYRGAAPINWSVIRGDKETGVTSFKLKHQIDTGDYLLQKRLPIGEDETAGELYERMRFLGAEVILETVQAIEREDIVLTPQDASLATSAPKIYHDTCQINWAEKVSKVYNFIRGMSPYPTAWTTVDGKQFNIIKCKKEHSSKLLEPGKVDTDNKSYMKISCEDGFINMEFIQMQGKRRMTIGDFLNGYKDGELLVTTKDQKQ